MGVLFWLGEDHWAAVEPRLPGNQPGARRVDDCRAIILHVLKVWCRWQDCPAEHGPSTTVYNHFIRRSRRRFCLGLLEMPAASGVMTRSTAVDSAYMEAQRSAFDRTKGGAKAQAIGPSRGGQTTKVHAVTDVIGRPFKLMLTPGNVSDVSVAPEILTGVEGAHYVLADTGHDANALRRTVRRVGAVPVIPERIPRKKIALDKKRYRDRRPIENAFRRLKDFRRIAARYDKLAANFLSAVALAATLSLLAPIESKPQGAA